MGLIKTLQIKNSEFFGENLRIDFSSKMNCIMGGRGTGKTTLLTILYWAINQDDSLPKEMLSLVKSNLGSGTVELVVEDILGNEYVVFKTYGDAPSAKTAAGEHVAFDEFASHIGIDFFPAGAIERIGLDPKHRLRLFDAHIGNEISELNGQIGIAVSQLKQSEIEIKAARRELGQIKEELLTFGNIEEDLKKAQAELVGVEANAEIKTRFEQENKKQSVRVIERNFLAKIREANSTVAQQLDRLRASITIALSNFASSSELENATLKTFFKTALIQYQALTTSVEELQAKLASIGTELLDTATTCKADHERADAEFSKLRQTIDKHRELFQRINTFSQRATAKKISEEKIKSLSDQMTALMRDRQSLLAKLNATIQKRAELRRVKAAAINEMLGHKVKILIKDAALNGSFVELLESILYRQQMRMTGAERRILEVSTPQQMKTFVEKDDATGFATRCGIQNVERVQILFKIIKETDALFELESCICEDAPNFYLGVEDDKNVESFKPTEELSTGQRCTAVLPVVFAMTSQPLLIDQPEDNLDNKYITQSIHEIIRKIKGSRQMLFVTHNPNIPVISDSEHNVFLSYFEQESHIQASGNIQAVKAQIVELLEGGKAAFVKRKDIYGY